MARSSSAVSGGVGSGLQRGGGAEVVLSSSAAIYLTERAIRYGPEAVAASFDRVMSGQPVVHASVVVVKGISSTSVIEVAPGVTVEPIRGLFDVSERDHAYAVGAKLHGDGDEPTAIVLRTSAPPAYCPRPLGPGMLPLLGPFPFPPLQPALDALSVVAGAAVVPDVSYSVVEEIGWPTMIAGGIGGAYIVERVTALVPDQGAVLRELSALLTGHARGDALDRAVRKLKDAQSRTSDDERSLDLGACLEILLMHGEKSDNTEIGYKLRMRSAWLLGRDEADRRRIHDLVRDAYSARSKVAHEGVLPPVKTLEALTRRSSQMRETEQLCRDLITHILRNGWPNWVATVLQG